MTTLVIERRFSPSLQRFISKDPIGLSSGDLNHYRYVRNSPSNFVDPSGLTSYLVSRDLDGAGLTSHNFILIEQAGTFEVISFGPGPSGDYLVQGYNATDFALSSFGSGTLENKVRIDAPDHVVQGQAANLTTYLQSNQVKYSKIPISGFSSNSNAAAQTIADRAQGSPVRTPSSSFFGPVGSSAGVCGYK